MKTIGYSAAVAFVLTIIAANWLVSHFGIVPVGLGLMAPAGVFGLKISREREAS
jgi:cadmium resistance protein CadD (predicted permease)